MTTLKPPQSGPSQHQQRAVASVASGTAAGEATEAPLLLAGDFQDARLPPGFTARRTATGAIELRDKKRLSGRRVFGLLCLGPTVGCMHYLYEAWKEIQLYGFDSGLYLPLFLLCVGWIVFGRASWAAFESEVVVVEPNRLELRRSLLDRCLCSSVTEGQIKLDFEESENGNSFLLSVRDLRDSSGHRLFWDSEWRYHRRGGQAFREPLWRQQLHFGLFLQEATGWPLCVTEQAQDEMKKRGYLYTPSP